MTTERPCTLQHVPPAFPSAYQKQAEHDEALRRRCEKYGAAPTTVEALIYELRTCGAGALVGSNCQRRITDLSVKQIHEVIERLDRLRPTYPAITDDLLLLLAELPQ